MQVLLQTTASYNIMNVHIWNGSHGTVSVPINNLINPDRIQQHIYWCQWNSHTLLSQHPFRKFSQSMQALSLSLYIGTWVRGSPFIKGCPFQIEPCVLCRGNCVVLVRGNFRRLGGIDYCQCFLNPIVFITNRNSGW